MSLNEKKKKKKKKEMCCAPVFEIFFCSVQTHTSLLSSISVPSVRSAQQMHMLFAVASTMSKISSSGAKRKGSRFTSPLKRQPNVDARASPSVLQPPRTSSRNVSTEEPCTLMTIAISVHIGEAFTPVAAKSDIPSDLFVVDFRHNDGPKPRWLILESQ